MLKNIIKFFVLILVFMGSLVGFSMLTNTTKIDLTTKMSAPTLPIVNITNGKYTINEMYGYMGDMNPMTMRDTITPLSEDLKLPITISAQQKEIKSITYSVRQLDMERLLEEKEIDISQIERTDGTIKTEIQLQNLMEPGQEYIFILTLANQKEEIHYYTRIIHSVDSHIQESLDFVMDFHNKTFDKKKAADLATFLEPSQDADNTTLHKVTIHSSLNQISWGDFEGTRHQKPIPSIKEIGQFYNTIVLNYVMDSKGKNGEVEYYNIEECFRVRYGDSRILLLDYQRSMNELYRGNGLSENEINLGIRDDKLHYVLDESENIVCFVQEGELWGYNIDTNRLSSIFSFRSSEGINLRENNMNHDIRIIRVSKSGSVDFAVYGYMNRGDHEGRTGVSVYHFDSEANTIEEQLFIESDNSYQILKENWAKLLYVSDKNVFYIIVDDTLHRVNLKTGKEKMLLSNLKDNNYAVSEDGRFISWRGEDQDNLLHVMDLESENERQIASKSKEYILPIGFMQNDLVYGLAKASDVKQDGQILMYKIIVIDDKLKVQKKYQKNGYRISNTYIENGTIFLKGNMKNSQGNNVVEEATINNVDMGAVGAVKMETKSGGEKQSEVRLVTEQVLQGKKPQVLTPKEIARNNKGQLEISSELNRLNYYVYVGGRVVLCTQDVSEAIQSADAQSGVVLGHRQKYIWRRGRAGVSSVADQVILAEPEFTSMSSNVARCIAALLQVEDISRDVEGQLNNGESPLKIMEEAMPEATILPLTGCNVDQILYYIGQGTAVYGTDTSGEPILIVGYDEFNTMIYYPQTNEVNEMGLNDSNTFFNNAGNDFIGYIQ
jgi:hypothetical protein